VLADADVATAVAAIQKQVTSACRPGYGRRTQHHSEGCSTHQWELVARAARRLRTGQTFMGCHHLTTEGLPMGKAFAASDRKAGTSWTVTASQERWEMLGNPNIHLTAFVQNSNAAGTLYAYEVFACEDGGLGYLARLRTRKVLG